MFVGREYFPGKGTLDVRDGLVAFQSSPWDMDAVSSLTSMMLISPRYGGLKIVPGPIPEVTDREDQGKHFPLPVARKD